MQSSMNRLNMSTEEVQIFAPGFRLLLVVIVLCGVLYPALTVLLNQSLFPAQANGSLIYVDNQAMGSEWVGQKFGGMDYFHSRPSAADYQPFDLGGSNLAPSNPELAEKVAKRATQLLESTSAQEGEMPVDMLMESGSGLDPHISPLAAQIQIDRVADQRNLPKETVQTLVEQYTQYPTFKILGQPRVHVLKLNIALDHLSKAN